MIISMRFYGIGAGIGTGSRLLSILFDLGLVYMLILVY